MITKLMGVRIKELRASTGLSQESFANKIDMARTYFAEVETGKRNISMRNLLKITSGLGVTLEEFFDSDLFAQLYDEEGGGAGAAGKGVGGISAGGKGGGA